jgi:hypothetical protein
MLHATMQNVVMMNAAMVIVMAPFNRFQHSPDLKTFIETWAYVLKLFVRNLRMFVIR